MLRKFLDSLFLCVYLLLKLYLKIIVDIRGDIIKLLLMIRKLYNVVISEIVVCWIKKVMIDVGIDMNIFSVYSLCFVVISVVKFMVVYWYYGCCRMV